MYMHMVLPQTSFNSIRVLRSSSRENTFTFYNKQCMKEGIMVSCKILKEDCGSCLLSKEFLNIKSSMKHKCHGQSVNNGPILSDV